MIYKLFFTLALSFFTAHAFSDDGIEDFFSSSPEQIVTLTESRDFLIGGIIHPLSGQPCLHQTDLVARGAQSLALKRTFIPFYTPLNEHNGRIHPSKNSYGGWVYFPHSHLNVFIEAKSKSNKFIISETIVSVSDPKGNVLTYTIDKNGNTKLKSKSWGICNGIDDHPSGINDPRNTKISLEKDQVILEAPDGTKRFYRCSDEFNLDLDKKSYFCLYCLLLKEILPNGKVLHYYHKERQVVKVNSLDPTETHVYATLNIDTPLEEKVAFCTTNTGLKASYTHHTRNFFKKNKHKKYVDLIYPLRLFNAQTPCFQNEIINYYDNPNDDSILSIFLGKQQQFRCIYKHIFETKKEKKPWLVEKLCLPSENSILLPVYSMEYDQGIPGKENSTTTVSHSDGIKTVYTFNSLMLPQKVCEYDQHENLIKEKIFAWTNKQWLESITIKDGNQQTLSEKKFRYDAFGNPISEILTGDLTGSGQVENQEIKRIYSTDGRNLLLREEYSDGKISCYSYMPETNLLTSCLIKENGTAIHLHREFRHYDEFNNLIQVINDDGSSDSVDDLTNVNDRKIVNYHLRQQQPFLHMPESVEVKFWENGFEKLFQKTSYVYDQWGNVAKEIVYDSNEKLAYTISKEYDEHGNLLSETNPLGQKAIYTYDAHGREKSSWNFGNNLYTTNDYDSRGRLIKTQEKTSDGLIRNYSFSYDDKNRLKNKIDNYNNSTAYSYDLIANKPIQINQPKVFHVDGTFLEVNEKANYDALGRKSLSIDANGNVTKYTYNLYGSPTSIVYPDQSQELFRYETNGLLSSHTSQNGLTVNYRYDVLRNVTNKSYFFNGVNIGNEIFVYKGDKLLKSYDLEGNLTEYTYDGLGRKISEEKCGCFTIYQYDQLGNVGTIYEENGENSLYTHFKRDLLGRVLEKKKTLSNGSTLRKISYTYDENGNVNTIKRNINGHEATETFVYDAYNRKISHQDAQGYLTTTHYDEKSLNNFGQQILKITVKDPLEISTVTTYDPYGRLAKEEKLNATLNTISMKEIDYDACGNLLANHENVYEGTDHLTTKTVKWTYDSCHRTKEMTRAFNTPEARTTKWSCYPDGKVATKTFPDELVLSYTYDPFNHLKTIQSSDGKLSHSFTYNRLGHLLSAADDLTHLQIKREVDFQGNLLKEEFPNGIQISKTYDHFHRPLSLSLPDRSKIIYQYDPLYLKKVERISPNGATVYQHTYDSYDESGYLLTEHLPANLGCVDHEMDLKGYPISISGKYFNQECQYDAVGNLTSQAVNGSDLTFAYDDLSQLISEPDSVYIYDSLYNRTKDNEKSLQYNDLDEPLSNQNVSFTYDLRGNLTKKSDALQTQIFRYDPLDRLIEAEINGKLIKYVYDPLGRKLSKTSTEKKEHFIYDERNEIGVVSENGKIEQLRILGSGSHPEQRNIVAIELESKAYAPLLDIQGNVRNLIDMNAKTTAASYNYTAFGKQFSSSNRVFNPWQYASKRFDPDLGLIDFGKRHYDPQLARWLTTDPAGFMDSHNLYQFNFNNPFRYCDPNGEVAFAIPLICIAFELGTAVTIEVVAAEVITAVVVATAVTWGVNEVLTGIQNTTDISLPLYLQESESKEKKSKIRGRHTPDQEALSELVQGRLKGGVSTVDADTLLEWADEYDFPSRDDRGLPHWDGGREHIHIGPGHLPVFPAIIL